MLIQYPSGRWVKTPAVYSKSPITLCNRFFSLVHLAMRQGDFSLLWRSPNNSCVYADETTLRLVVPVGFNPFLPWARDEFEDIMKLTIELDETDTEEVIEKGQALMENIDRLDGLIGELSELLEKVEKECTKN